MKKVSEAHFQKVLKRQKSANSTKKVLKRQFEKCSNDNFYKTLYFNRKSFCVILEYNLYPFIIRTLGGLSDFEVTNCQPFLLLHSALICFLGISLCHKGNTFLSNMCCVL